MATHSLVNSGACLREGKKSPSLNISVPPDNTSQRAQSSPVQKSEKLLEICEGQNYHPPLVAHSTRDREDATQSGQAFSPER